MAENVEQLVARLGRPQALAKATRVREQAAKTLGGWSHARFVSEGAHLERLQERGEFQDAREIAQQLLDRCLVAGEAAYSEARYDIATAYLNIGQLLKREGAAEEASVLLAEAQRRFEELDDKASEHMASVIVQETGECLLLLGRLDEAASFFEEGIKRAHAMGNLRQGAAVTFGLGKVRQRQGFYREALGIYMKSLNAFVTVGEPLQVASCWYQIGMVHERGDEFEPAEQAYRQSLSVRVQEKDLVGQASSLNQLGRLYARMGRLEDAVSFFRQAAEYFIKTESRAQEGDARTRLSETLFKLFRHDEAMLEIQLALECKRHYGHAVERWTTWSVLESLECALGHSDAAQAARQQAVEAYLAYRRDGGASKSTVTQLFVLTLEAIKEENETEVRFGLDQIHARSDAPLPLKSLVAQLQSVLAGDRNPALASHPGLDYLNAVELQLLLELL